MADDAVRKLEDDLNKARHIYAHDLRLGSTYALQALIAYLDEIGVDTQLKVPLIGLSGAMADALQGISNPHTVVEKYGKGEKKDRMKGPKSPIQSQLAMGFAAATVTLLKKAGDSLPKALAEVERASGIPNTKLKEFRKRITRGDSTVRREAADLYGSTVSGANNDARNDPQKTPRLLANAALATLRNMISKPKV